MNTTPNKRKRRRKNESFETEKMSQSSSINQENVDSTGNKWKRRLHSLRRSLSKKKVTKLKEFERNQDQNEVQECSFENKNGEHTIADITFDNRCSENIELNGWQQNCNERQSPLLNGCSSKDSPNLNPPIPSDNNKINVKKRKGFHRRTKGDTVRGNKNHHSTSQQDLQNGKNKSLNGLERLDSEAKRSRSHLNGRKNKRLSLFSGWFKLPSRASSEKNLKRRGRGLSVSTGNFNEQEGNFKLLTDVKLLRDPGYVSSSGDSLDLGEDRYHSLRRSRASLIDIKWHKHAKSEGNLASPVSRNRSLTLSPSSSSNRKEILLSNKTTPNIRRNSASKHRQENRKSLPVNIDVQNPSGTWEDWDQVSPEVPQCSDSLGSFGNTTEDDDVYLTAEDDSTGSSPNLFLDSSDQPLPECSKETESKEQISGTESIVNRKISADSYFSGTPNGKGIPLAGLPVSDINRNVQQVTQATKKSCGVVTPNSSSLNEGQIVHVQPAKDSDDKASSVSIKNNIGTKPITYVCKNCQAQASGWKTIKPKDFHKLSLGQLTDLNDIPLVSMRCMQCRSSRLSKQSDTCHDVLITRPPKKPAPKPPALMKNKSKSLTALAGKFPILSEQLDLNETSSLHKLNDSCSDNLCELLLQSKDTTSPTSEGVYVGIMGDQGVILRKRRMYHKQNRVVSMPSELLENVMEVEGAEVQSSTKYSGKSYSLQSAESEVYLSCNSEAPSSYNSNTPLSGVQNNSTEKVLCMRSVSISSIDVQDLSMKKKIHSQSVPCLAFSKGCLDGLKATQINQGVLEDSAFPSQTFSIPKDCISRQSSTAQSMMSLNFQQPHEGSDDTSDKVRY
jgi:hypothetical protein